MKVLVIGAAGKTGSAVVKQALAAGHEVTVLTRDAGDSQDQKVRLIQGDATDNSLVEQAVAGQEAIVDTIGGKTPYRANTLEETVARNVIASMKRNGVRRLIVTSMVGEGDSRANATVWERLLIATFLRGADKDKANMEHAVEASDVDWTIVRPAILSDDDATGQLKIVDSESGEKVHKITRADLAAFLVAQLSSAEYLNQAVTIGNS